MHPLSKLKLVDGCPTRIDAKMAIFFKISVHITRALPPIQSFEDKLVYKGFCRPIDSHAINYYMIPIVLVRVLIVASAKYSVVDSRFGKENGSLVVRASLAFSNSIQFVLSDDVHH